MKKILVLGTGNAQADFVSFCKTYGLEVYTCSYKKEGRGIGLSDHFELMNITDADKVTAYARNKGIDLIYSVGSELAMPTISRVSEACALPLFNSTKTTTTCQNKHLMREAISACSEFTVNFREAKDLDSLEDLDLYPAVVKPVDSQGQRGVSFVQNASGLKKAFDRAMSYSISRTIIVEEYIEGFEISVNTYMLNGHPLMNFVTERISFDEYPGGIIKSHIYPVSQKYNKEKVQQLIISVLQHLGIVNGPAYLQLKVDSQGNPKVIEVTPRLDGCHLWRMIYLTKGIHLFGTILDHLFTGQFRESDFQKPVSADLVDAAYLDFFTQPPDSLMSREQHQEKKDSLYTEWYYKNGELVPKINGYAEKVGYQIHLSS